MRKMILIVVFIVGLLFTIGCSREFLAHDTLYKTNDHMFFSWDGHENPGLKDIENQEDQGGWWGETIQLPEYLLDDYWRYGPEGKPIKD